ncbi:MAG: GIY-YIG nuclease family protein [Verrucomicrobia bacterium]|nr:GIY-YIG nuclease family protein [Verrucomicrobiota bacterium]
MHIYKFTHIETGKCYIGQTIQDPNQRRLEHIADSRHTPKTYHFHNALRKYGIEAFTFEVIDSATTLEDLNRLEEKYVLLFDSIDNGFNIRNPGDNKTHNIASIERMRESQRKAHARRKLLGTDTWTRKDGGAMKGKYQSKDTKEKMKLVDGKRVWMEASV